LDLIVNEYAGFGTFQVENVDVEVADGIAGKGDALTVGREVGDVVVEVVVRDVDRAGAV